MRSVSEFASPNSRVLERDCDLVDMYRYYDNISCTMFVLGADPESDIWDAFTWIPVHITGIVVWSGCSKN